MGELALKGLESLTLPATLRQERLIPLGALLLHLSCPCICQNSQDSVVAETQLGSPISPGHGLRPVSVPAMSLLLMQTGLGISSAFSKRQKAVSLENAAALLTLEVFAPRQFSLLLWCFQCGRSVTPLGTSAFQRT